MMLKAASAYLTIALLTCSPGSAALGETGANAQRDPGAPEKGIWIGDLALCNAGPVKASTALDEYNGFPIVQITLPETLAEALGKLTTANVGKPLPIRVDGKVISQPYVNEPILGGQLQISGVDQAEAERIVAMLQACPEDAPQNSRVIP